MRYIMYITKKGIKSKSKRNFDLMGLSEMSKFIELHVHTANSRTKSDWM